MYVNLNRVPVKSSQAARSSHTRKALIRAGRTLFAEKGFANTPAERLVASAGVSRGALYHQFEDKRDLFRAVVEEVEQDLAAHVGGLLAGMTDTAQMLHRGSEAFLEAANDPEVRQILLIDAPSVIGWQAWREIDARYGLGLVRALLARGVEDGTLDPHPVEELSHVLLGAISEAAILIAHRADDEPARRRVTESVRWLIDRIIGEPHRRPTTAETGRPK